MSEENKNQMSLGKMFIDAREAKKLSLEDVSKGTKVHINILKAIESDNIKNMGIVYAKSFLKIYSHYLGLNTEEVMNLFHENLGPDEISQVRKVSFPNSTPSRLKTRKKPFWLKIRSALVTLGPVFRNIDFKVLGIILLSFLFVFGAVKFFSRPKNTKSAVVKNEVSSPQTKGDASEKEKTEVSSEKERLIKNPVSKSENIVLVVKAKEKCWLQVKVDGKVVFWSVLAKGAAESWQAKDKIELRLGNAGVVELELNGKVLERIGRPGQTLKNVVITREGLSVKD